MSYIETFLGASEDKIKEVLQDKGRYYVSYPIKKRSGGNRWINSPISFIRDWQNKILYDFLYKFSPHPIAHGFVKRRSPLTNAKKHTGKKILLTLDLKNFFPSITTNMVFKTLKYLASQNVITDKILDDDLRYMAEILTYRGGLVQGAPSSPAISNLVCIKLDTQIARLVRKFDSKCTVTRYADDIAISGDNNQLPKILKPLCGIINHAMGLQVNYKKIHIRRQSRRMVVTGVVVNKIPNINKIRLRQFRAKLHNIAKTNSITAEEYQKLRGYIEWIKSLHPTKGQQFLTMLSKIPVTKV